MHIDNNNFSRRFCGSDIKRKIALLIFVSFFIGTPQIHAQSDESAPTPGKKTYTTASRKHSAQEIIVDATMSYLVLWAGYAVSQYPVVEKISLDDFNYYLFEKVPVFWDGDHYFMNFVAHPWYGSEYYLYYRSRGYSVKSSLFALTLVNITFEFLVESTSQPPSINDIVITSVLGGIIGYYREIYAIKMLNSNNKYNRIIGHIVWPETMLWFFETSTVTPVVALEDGKLGGGLQFSLHF